MNKVFIRYTDTQALNQPLGNFSTLLVSHSWVWKYSPSEQQIGIEWDFYHILSGCRQSVNRHYHHGSSTLALPPDILTASVSLHGPLVRLLLIGSIVLIVPTGPSLSFSQTLDQLPALLLWDIQEYTLPSDLSSIIASLADDTARAISDRLYNDKFDTSAFIVVDSNDSSIPGLNVVPGHPGNQGAYRSELTGLFGIVLLCAWADISSADIKVGCNGFLALNNAFDTWPLEPSDPHFDMLSALRQMIAASPLSWTTRHVNGHQDNDATTQLDFGALKNIEMDNLAKVFWMQHSHFAPVVYPISDEGFQVWLGNQKLSSSPSLVF